MQLLGRGQPDPLVLFGFAILIMIGLALVVLVYSNRARRHLVEQTMKTQALEIEHQRALLEHNVLVQEAERQRIAAQLHDDIGSKLGVLSLTFHRLRRLEGGTPTHETVSQEITELISGALATTRRLSHELLPPTLEDFGLVQALLEFCEGIRKTDAVAIEFTHDVPADALPTPEKSLHLYRMVQELANNTLKYAQAQHIRLRLWHDAEGLHLHYADDGQGFDYQPTQPRGLGLKNLENRVRMLGGRWEVDTAPGRGFQASVHC